MNAMLWILTLALFPQSQILAQQQGCELIIELSEKSREARVRPVGEDYSQCLVSETALGEGIKNQLNAWADLDWTVRSVNLGRAINYPWLVDFLIEASLASTDWDIHKGRSLSGGDNRFVSRILSEPVFIRRLQAFFEGSPYTVIAVNVEKVLIGDSTVHHSDLSKSEKVPFDAQVRLIIEYQEIKTKP
ncbi:hypothetical protein [Methylicorpusculum sp.]|uniref:hypothetical protein n=1 Tax=Methylicorpusculum sp. TaxID=2713644 RepID=UPI00272F8917|nr:hypothetical protein [Methylicorpusculum sp.]MDP2179525.1 hypothetical protein [Methylicorpusculum sp.]MDP3529778.1 hypothetical protein [Methylicorpusculum sp.]MDZ4152933.1 hypothetical protein [Methylicorpusculum sp.]